MATKVPRGVRKLSELSMQTGRSLIVTEEDANKLDWTDIPDGTLKINKHTGLLSQKLEGESDWVPAGIKNDGTICIAKDSVITTEVYEIIDIPEWIDEEERYAVDETGEGEFRYWYYTDDVNDDGTKKKEKRTGRIIDDGKNIVFYLQSGSYIQSRNHLNVNLDGVLLRNEKNGGLTETTERSFALHEKLEVGQKITAEYIRIFRLGNPFPRIFMTKEIPADAEVGDMWIDYAEDVETAEETLNESDAESTISWDRIVGCPNSISGYGIIDKLAPLEHTHVVADIEDLKKFLKNGSADSTVQINADALEGHKIGLNSNNILVLDDNGYIPSQVINKHSHSVLDIKGIHIGVNPPANPTNNSTIWFNTADGDTSVQVYTANHWLRLGAAWEV